MHLTHQELSYLRDQQSKNPLLPRIVILIGSLFRLSCRFHTDHSRLGKTAIVQNRPYVFVDEIKATLPVTTTMNHHILFTLTTVDIKKGGNVSIIGYAIYPLSGP